MARWTQPQYKTTRNLLSLGDGENVGVPALSAEDNESIYSRNMDSRNYPAASVRPGRTQYATANSTLAHTLGVRNDEYLHVVDGVHWKYWDPATTAYVQLSSSINSTEALLLDFVTSTNTRTFLGNGHTWFKYMTGSTAVSTLDSTGPKTKIFTVNKGRIFAQRQNTTDYNNQIQYCALNHPAANAWGAANDAGTIEITNAKGGITAMAEYGDTVIVWTEHSMHELYGTSPSNFELVDIEGNIGCISNRSVVKCQEKLYWLGYDGFYQYNGAVPVKVSDKVDSYIKNINFTYKTKCVAGSVGDFIYLAIPYGSSATQNNLILKYDTRLRKWYPETPGNFVDFATMGRVLYGLDTDGKIWNMRDLTAVDDNGTAISWSLVTKPFMTDNIKNVQTLSEIDLVINRTTDSTAFSVGYSTNIENNTSDAFTAITASTVTASSNTQMRRLRINANELSNVPWYRLRFAGAGQTVIHNIQKCLRVKQ